MDGVATMERDRQTDMYLSELLSYSLDRLKKEPDVLQVSALTNP